MTSLNNTKLPKDGDDVVDDNRASLNWTHDLKKTANNMQNLFSAQQVAYNKRQAAEQAFKKASSELEAAKKGLQYEKDGEEENNESETKNTGSTGVKSIMKTPGITDKSNDDESDAKEVKIVTPPVSSFARLSLAHSLSTKKSKSTSKPNVTKKAKDKARNPLLKCVQELVECQPTPDLRNLIFALSEDILIGLQEIKKRDHALAKLCSDNDYIPTSIRYDSSLYYPEGLAKDQATIDAEADFKDVILKSQLKLAGIIKMQAERNQDHRITTFQNRVIKGMIELGTFYVEHQREECELFAATANNDTLSKGAVINFIASIGWLDKFQPQVLEKPLHIIFPQKIGENYLKWQDRVTEFVKNLCEGNKDKDGKEKYELLLHNNNREVERKRYITRYSGNVQNSSDRSDYDLNLEDSDEDNINISTPHTPTRSIIKNKVTPVLYQQPVATHQVDLPVYRRDEYKFTWNGNNLFQRAKEEEPKTPFEAWLKMEKYTQGNVLFTDGMELNKSNSKKEQEKENIKLCDQILFWFIELFPSILCRPFAVANKELKRKRAAATLTRSIKSNAKHKLANDIKERLENDEEHIRVPREELNKLANISKNGANGRNKRPKITRKKEEEEANKTTQAPNPYNQRTTKRNTTTTKGGQHDFRIGRRKAAQGRRKLRQQQNKEKGKGKGKGNKKDQRRKKDGKNRRK